MLAAGALLLGPAVLAQSVTDTRETQRGTAPSAPLKAQPPVVKPPTARPDPGAKVSLSPDGQTVYLVGMIMEGSFHKFDEVLRTAPKVRTVHLSSAGGYTIEARLIAALVRKRKLDTYVEFYCASACTQIFAAGKQRTIGPSAQVGFHQAVLVDSLGAPTRVRPRTDRKLTSTTVFGVNGNDTLRLAYELAGVTPEFIDKALSYSHENMWLPSPQELLDAHVATRRTDTSELPPPPGGGGTREEVTARLLRNPLWRAALDRTPKAANAAIDEVWRASNSGYSMEEATAVGRSSLIMEATKTIHRAPDAILDRSLALYAGSARTQRQRGYPACKAQFGTTIERETEDLEFERREDALVTDFLMSSERVQAMDGIEATRIFSREVVPKLADAYRTSYLDGKGGKCRLGYRTFEAIDALPAKQRIKAYRALLSLPGLADDD
jgi:hypothetical protein